MTRRRMAGSASALGLVSALPDFALGATFVVT